MSRITATLILMSLGLAIGVAQKAGATKKNQQDGLEYAWIVPGVFEMGCARDDCPPNERPAHKINITRGFWIGTTEVTTGAYKLFVHATGRTMPPDAAQGFNVNPSWKNDRLPIVNVTWNEAADYCKWVGGSLPTEAQWEYAARGGSNQDPYGPLDEIAWTASNSGRQKIDAEVVFKNDKTHYEEALRRNGNGPHEVGVKRPNGFGLYDMIGNAAEFTNDWADLSYYTHSPEQDPTGPATGEARVLRGGHFLYPDTPNRASKRLWGDPSERSPIVGFRCALP